jgi:branched-chain amino acid transport system substrate-binding protein
MRERLTSEVGRLYKGTSDMKTKLMAVAAVLCLMATQTQAAETVKVGVITTLSGPGGALGKHLKDGAELALQNLGGKLGGLNAQLIFGDDQFKPDVGRQVAEEMIEKDNVNFLTGVIWSNVMLATLPSVTKSHTIMISTSAGPSEIAGKMCSPYFFTDSWLNAGPAEAMGKYLNSAGINDVFAMVPNYAAGRDMMGGFKDTYKGKMAAELYTPLGNTDFQTELTQIRAANPKAVFLFEPGAYGIQFFKQFDQAGLHGKIPVYSIFTTNEVILPALGATANGVYETSIWAPDLKNAANQTFVRDFVKKYGYIPSEYAATAYDSIYLINSAVKAVKGNLADKKGLIAAIEKARIDSVRGPFKFNTNHFPIENYYLVKVTKQPDGKYARNLVSVVASEVKDSYYKECRMK